MTIAADMVTPRPGVLGRLVGALKSLVFGSLLCLTPITALIVLGWLMRRMRFVSAARAGLATDRPGWIMGRRGAGALGRPLGGLAANIREGFLALLSLA
ncbi:MAG: hypothetical protein KJN93_04180, partial [Alphaproteobacteria bacterium]|nr:hypothetical protein [Alphaproteobacteria bacterium]